jgi:elongation factor P hydroxylase
VLFDKECQDFVVLLNQKFLVDYNTVLKGGYNEPFYQACTESKAAEIQFTKNYIRSAIHELAHWCVAGVERRKLDDYGYWYAEDGRSQQQQDEFFKVEVKPQTIEWAFSIVAGIKFEVSVDNLTTSVEGVDEFKTNVTLLMREYLNNGFPMRVTQILKILSKSYNIESYPNHIAKFINC